MKYAFFPGCTWKSAAGYRESVEAVNQQLDIELEEITNWNCCGATVCLSMNQGQALFLGARILALAGSMGYGQLVTGCNACYTTLRKIQKKLKESEEESEAVASQLQEEGLDLNLAVRIRHHLEILVNDIDGAAWKRAVKRDYSDVKVAPYYGCQLTRPWRDIRPEDILEKLIALSGFTPVEHTAKSLCCGAALAVPYKAEGGKLIKRIIQGISMKGADLVTTICPLCQFNMDQGQMGFFSSDAGYPVTYYSQIAGLGLGIPPEELGLLKLFVPVDKEMIRNHENR